MTDRPHVYLVRSSDDRALAAALIADPSTAGIEVDLTEGALRIQAVDFGRFTALLPKVARDQGIRLLTVSPSDESLESVFSYLVTA
jgi:ABC-2 type transport system ATP-binding protein